MGEYGLSEIVDLMLFLLQKSSILSTFNEISSCFESLRRIGGNMDPVTAYTGISACVILSNLENPRDFISSRSIVFGKIKWSIQSKNLVPVILAMLLES